MRFNLILDALKKHFCVTSAMILLLVFSAAAKEAPFARAIGTSSPQLSPSESSFNDVGAAHPNALAIRSLKDANIVSGYPDGRFAPDQALTRAEAVAIILKAADIAAGSTSSAVAPGSVSFNDVPQSAWFFPMIQRGVSLGKLRGYTDGTFRPNNPVTMPEAVTMALSFFGIGASGINVENVIYQGLDTRSWYSLPMQYAKNNNIIEPDERGVIDGAAALRRGQFAEIIYRLRSARQTGAPFNLAASWPAEEHLDNFWRIKRPADWEVFKGLKNSAIWKKNPAVGANPFFSRLWPASGRLAISLVENSENLSAAQYFANLKNLYENTYSAASVHSSQFMLSGKNAMKISIPDRRITDLAVYLPNRNALIFNGDYGEAPIGEFLKKQIEAVELSYEFTERPPVPPQPVIPLAQRMETLRENLLTAGKWNDVAGLFPDKRLIFTDAIGVGTGPVDYYFSREANHTIKLERNSGTILNIREGETHAF